MNDKEIIALEELNGLMNNVAFRKYINRLAKVFKENNDSFSSDERLSCFAQGQRYVVSYIDAEIKRANLDKFKIMKGERFND